MQRVLGVFLASAEMPRIGLGHFTGFREEKSTHVGRGDANHKTISLLSICTSKSFEIVGSWRLLLPTVNLSRSTPCTFAFVCVQKWKEGAHFKAPLPLTFYSVFEKTPKYMVL